MILVRDGWGVAYRRPLDRLRRNLAVLSSLAADGIPVCAPVTTAPMTPSPRSVVTALLHCDHGFERIAAVTGHPLQWYGPEGRK